MLCAFFALTFCTVTAGADLEKQAGQLKNALPNETRHIMQEIEPTGADLQSGLKTVVQDAAENIGDHIKSGAKTAVLLLAVVILGGVGGSISPEGNTAAVNLAVVLSAALISVSETGSMIATATDTIENMTDFSRIMLPVLGSSAAAAGKPASAAVLYAATMAFSQLLMTVIKNYALPLTYAYIACCVANAAIGGKVLGRMAKLIKQAITISLTVLIFIYIGYLSISGAVSGSADAVSVKAAKLTISTLVPVLGGIISDAAETVVAGAGILKNSVGVFGLLAVLAMCLGPFIGLGIKYLVYKLTAAICGAVADDRVVALIDSISGAFAMIIGMVGATALMLFVSIISGIRMVA